MRYWLHGKRGGLIGFLAIAALVTGGLGWVSSAVLRLEQEQRQARADADLFGQLRLALWQLDAFVLPDLSREHGRPFSQYSPQPAGPLNRGTAPPTLAEAQAPDWIMLHFQTDDREWKSPEMARAPVPPKTPPPDPRLVRRRERVLAELKKHWRACDLLARLREQGPSPVEVSEQLLAQNTAGNQFNNTFNSQSPLMNRGVDYGRRQSYGNRIVQQAAQPPVERPARKPITVSLGRQLVPLWLNEDGRPRRLVLVRRAQVGQREICQGVVVDWPRLQQALAEQVHDLFPDARLVPMPDRPPPRPERTMTALPIELDPGPSATEVPPPGWNPLRIGLVTAWAAVGLALLAVVLGGWSLLDLSERRSRFVSAVTHELRTPLTTLRLYLDMLTSGLVQEEKQKTEYLHTLHAETDRLNRLIANVLDFARLEKQRPRLEKTPTRLADLLEQLRSTWQTRCHDAGKELVIDNAAPPDTSLVTDVHLVQQTVGNLIDNACKYSREAPDPRLWLRAALDRSNLVIEVEDTGPGIPARERRSIFRPFRRGRGADVTAGGVGLGLALAQRWSRLLAGRLTLRSPHGKPGCRFRFEVPLS